MKIRLEYQKTGVNQFYKTHADSYRNPHESCVVSLIQSIIPLWNLNLTNVLDLSCGSGEATLPLLDFGASVQGIDPFTCHSYQKRTKQLAEKMTFDDICKGSLDDRNYSMIVCSYAIHLLERSKLPLLLYKLSEISKQLLIISPTKTNIQHYWTLKNKSKNSYSKAFLYESNV